jgi:hypothetical protein
MGGGGVCMGSVSNSVLGFAKKEILAPQVKKIKKLAVIAMELVSLSLHVFTFYGKLKQW